MAPYELTLFSFLDSQGVEQDFTTSDPGTAHAYASRHGLVVVRNSYEFVTSEPVADFTGQPVKISQG
jgi:hypothetical protein